MKAYFFASPKTDMHSYFWVTTASNSKKYIYIYIYKQFGMYWNLPHVTLSPLKSELWETSEGKGKLLIWVLSSGEMTLAAPGLPRLRQNAQFYMSTQGSSLVLFIYSLFFCIFLKSKHSKVFNVCFFVCILTGYGGFPGGLNGKASTCNAGDMGSIPGSRRSLGEGNGNLLQYSRLENHMDGGAW